MVTATTLSKSEVNLHEGFAPLLSRKRVMLVLGMLALLVLLVVGLKKQQLSPVALRIDSVQFYGELRWLRHEELNEVMKPFLQTNFFSADLDGIKQSLEKLPWVESASVRRVWPSRLNAIIKEHVAVARWQEDSLINDKGALFYPGKFPEGLVRLDGPSNAQQELFAQYRELQPLFAGYGLAVSRMFLNERRALGLELSNGLRIDFGRITSSMDLYYVTARFLKVYMNDLLKQAGKMEVVDLRYTNGFSVQWKNSENN